jgi:hypothetical protein
MVRRQVVASAIKWGATTESQPACGSCRRLALRLNWHGARIWTGAERDGCGLVAHFFLASVTISTTTLLASSGLRTSRKKAIRAPRMPSGVLKRT